MIDEVRMDGPPLAELLRVEEVELQRFIAFHRDGHCFPSSAPRKVIVAHVSGRRGFSLPEYCWPLPWDTSQHYGLRRHRPMRREGVSRPYSGPGLRVRPPHQNLSHRQECPPSKSSASVRAGRRSSPALQLGD